MSAGYLGWESRYLSGVPYLDGVDWTATGHPLDMDFSPSEDGQTFVIPTASGESVLQSPIADDAASDSPQNYRFTLPMQLADENAFRRMMIASAKGTAVRFVPHLFCMEHFAAQAVSDVRSLSRPLAWTLAAGVTSVTHPCVFYKDGVIDSNCASLSGTLSQVLTVAEAGDIAVWYIPAFSVLVREVSNKFIDVGNLVCTVSLEEVRRYA